jgi:hypothetical protein
MDENGSESSAPARIEQRLPGWIPVVLVVAMALGLTKQLYGLVLQFFPGAGPGNGGVTYISLSLRLAQWSIWPDYTDVGPMVLVPAAVILWFTVSRVAWMPTPGWGVRRAAALLLGACAALALARGIGVLFWSLTASDIERANIGLTPENGAFFLFNSGLFGQLWFAAVVGVLTWCFLVAQPVARTQPSPQRAGPSAPSPARALETEAFADRRREATSALPPPEVFRRPVDGHTP